MDFGNDNSKEMKVFVWITMKLAMKYTDKLFSLRNRGFIVKLSSINVLQILRENITKSYSTKISRGLK